MPFNPVVKLTKKQVEILKTAIDRMLPRMRDPELTELAILLTYAGRMERFTIEILPAEPETEEK